LVVVELLCDDSQTGRGDRNGACEVQNELVVLHFDTADAAEATMLTIGSLEAEGFIELEEAALITRSESGEVTVTPMGDSDVTTKPALGGVIGLAAGAIVGLPVLGALALGGIAAKKAVEKAATELDAVLDTVAKRVETGTAALALSVLSLPDPETVTDRLSIHRDAMTRVDIPPELRAEIDAHQRSD
jgi:uncharacterized membrane protein